MRLRVAAAGLAASALSSGVLAAPLTVPFDFSRGEIAVAVTLHGAPALALLDTGVDPSAVDLARAEAAHLKVDRGGGADVSGEGAGHVTAFAATIDGLAIGGRSFPPAEALASDMGAISKGYGKPIDLILGYSFLSRQSVLIDYPGRTVTFVDNDAEAKALAKGCRRTARYPLGLLKDLNWPSVPLRFGATTAPVSLDTGSNGSMWLLRSALALPGVKAALRDQEDVAHAGFNGSATTRGYTLDMPLALGPFAVPAGQKVTLHDEAGSRATRVANIGNPLLAAMKLKMLLDYRTRHVTFWGDCG